MNVSLFCLLKRNAIRSVVGSNPRYSSHFHRHKSSSNQVISSGRCIRDLFSKKTDGISETEGGRASRSGAGFVQGIQGNKVYHGSARGSRLNFAFGVSVAIN